MVTAQGERSKFLCTGEPCCFNTDISRHAVVTKGMVRKEALLGRGKFVGLQGV